MDWLVSISGPEFLICFTLISLIALGVGRFLSSMRTMGVALPDVNKLDPILFATLRGGWQVVIDVVIVQLIERKIAKITVEARESRIAIEEPTENLSPVDRVVYHYLLVPKTTSQMKYSNMKSAIESELQPVYRKLENMHLCKTEKEVSQDLMITYLIILCLDVFAFVKICLGVEHHKPILFLILLTVISSFAIFKGINPRARITALGRKYIRVANRHFLWMKEDLTGKNAQQASTCSSAIAAAIFGTEVLIFSEIFEDYWQFEHRRKALGVSSSDYGGSGSSSGGDSSGGGDGGSGGCGGGGCGGCGGCGS